MHSLPVPPAAMIQNLVSLAPKLKAKSIWCSHIGSTTKHYPLWIISFWFKVFHLHKVHHAWVVALSAMQKCWNTGKHKLPEESAKLLDKATNAFSWLPWMGLLKGFEVAIPIHLLLVYATQAWLTNEHEDQMLNLLQWEMMELGIGSPADIECTVSNKDLASLCVMSTIHHWFQLWLAM